MFALPRALLIAALTLAPISSGFALDRVLPAPRIKDNGDVRLADDLKIGRFQDNKFVVQPEKIELQGSGSLGEISGMNITPNFGAPSKTLAWTAAWLSGTGTVADLRVSLRSTIFNSVETMGYAAYGDGGGARYLYTTDNSLADDGCSVIVAADGGRWKLDLSKGIDPKQCGAKFDNATDDSARINRAITVMAAAGGGTVRIPANNGYRAGGIQLRSGVRIEGPGELAGTMWCTSDPCVTKVPGVQLSGTWFTSQQIRPANDSLREATIFKFGSINQSRVAHILIRGFLTDTTGGTIMDIGGEVDVTLPPGDTLGANVIWNKFTDITTYGCGICWKIRGKYATGPNQGNGDPPYPAQVTTHNDFSFNYTFFVNNVGIRIENSADTNQFPYNLFNLHGKNVVGIQHGWDVQYAGHNTWVGANKFPYSAFSADSGPQTITLFQSNVYSSALEADGFETDVDPNRPGYVVMDMPFAKSYRICGKRLDNIGNDWLGCLKKGIAWDQTLVASAPASGFSLPWPGPYSRYILAGGGTLASGTIALPCNPPDGLRATFATSGLTVTNLTVVSCAGAAQNIYGVPGTVSEAAPIVLRFDKGANGWFRD